MAMQEMCQRLKIETGAAQRRAEAHVIDTAESTREKMLESAADKIRYEDEGDRWKRQKGGEESQYSRVSECDQLLSNEQSASDKLRVENEESDCLAYCDTPGNEEEEEEGEDREMTAMRMQMALNQSRAASLRISTQISFAASYVHDAIDKQNQSYGIEQRSSFCAAPLCLVVSLLHFHLYSYLSIYLSIYLSTSLNPPKNH